MDHDRGLPGPYYMWIERTFMQDKKSWKWVIGLWIGILTPAAPFVAAYFILDWLITKLPQ